MDKIKFCVIALLTVFLIGCTEKSSTTTTVEYGKKGISSTTWKCVLSTNTLTFIFTSETAFQFSDEYLYNGKPSALIAHGTYTFSDSKLKLTFTDSTGEMPGNQTCTVNANQFKYGGHTFVKQ